MNDLSAVISSLTLVYTVVVVIAIALRQLVRLYSHLHSGRGVPSILKRDMIFFWGLVILIVIPSIAAILDFVLTNFLPWVVIRSVIGISVLTMFAYYEFVLIGRREKVEAEQSGGTNDPE